jgi:SAM-dependent methyltransferase
MSPKVYETFVEIAQTYFASNAPKSVLEIGAANWTLLSIPCFEKAQKTALNASFKQDFPQLEHLRLAVGNSNDMEFEDSEFDCIMSSSVMEHDKYFWRSLAESYRTLSSNGLLIIGVPIYMDLPTDWKSTTLTFKRHGKAYDADFYRFSEQAVREVLLEKLTVYSSVLVRKYPNPYMVMAGIKK